MDERFHDLQVRRIAECLNASGHSDAARAMHRVQQVLVCPASDGRVHVWLRCSTYDTHLLRALTRSSGSRSAALDDAYRQVFPWLSGGFWFRFVVEEGLAATA